MSETVYLPADSRMPADRRAVPRPVSVLISLTLAGCIVTTSPLSRESCSAWDGSVRRALVFRSVKLADDTYQIRLSARTRDEWALMAHWRPFEVPAPQRHLLYRAAEITLANNRRFFEVLPPRPIRVAPEESSYVLFKDEVRPAPEFYVWRHYHLDVRFLSDEAAKTTSGAVNAEATLRENEAFHAQQRGRCS